MLKLFSSPGRTGGLFPRLKAPTETKTAEITRISAVYWSEWRDLNSRPLDPQSSALPAALHPVNVNYNTTASKKKQVFFSFFRLKKHTNYYEKCDSFFVEYDNIDGDFPFNALFRHEFSNLSHPAHRNTRDRLV